MRRAQKAQLLEILQTLREANETIKKYISRSELEMAHALLGECQQTAIQTGTIIEESEGGDCPVVQTLEAYCEVLYQVNVDIPETISAQRAHKLLNKALLRVENSVKTDISARLEVIFLPYKASMWDSFKSVWQAANADPNCDAYVIPIPYYDKNPDGSFREMHYEGGQYPKDVPVVWYKDYDFAKRRPDMVFIHNPYDECNYVTSVEPFYYAKNLKQYTEQLVYIPYFVLGDIDPGNGAALKDIEHFCMTPGVFYADKVIVQSEAMRQAYINVLAKHLGKQTQNQWEKKILGLGSPKFDKVQNFRKEDLDIPKDWLKIVQRSDGSWKRIILYNTSVAALLEHNDKMLEKIRDVFRIFQENRNEVVLLWRPHPLLQATIKSMRPQLWRGYQQIVYQYRAEGWGIYDDSPDLNRAVVISDAYYGDPSSIIPLYQRNGKCALVQNQILCGEDLVRESGLASFSCAVKAGDKLFFFSDFFGELFEVNIKTSATQSIARLRANQGLNDCFLYGAAIRFQEKLYFIPRTAKHVAVFDLGKKHLRILDGSGFTAEANEKFLCCETYRNKIFLFPFREKKIFYIDTKQDRVVYAEKMDRQVSNALGSGVPKEFCCSLIVDDLLFLPVMSLNKIIVYDLKEEKASCMEVGGIQEGIVRAVPWRDRLLLLTEGGTLVFWDYKAREILWSVNLYSEEFLGPVGCNEVICYGDQALLLPKLSARILVMDLNTRRCRDLAPLPDGYKIKRSPYEYSIYCGYIQEGEVVYIFQRRSNMLLKVNMKTMDISGNILRYPDYVPTAGEDMPVYTENRIPLRTFLHMPCGVDLRQERSAPAGERIFAALRGQR